MLLAPRKLSLMALALACLALSRPASAGYSGSMSFDGIPTLNNGSNLANTTSISLADVAMTPNTITVDTTAGAFTVIPTSTVFNTSTLSLTSLGSFSISSSSYGMFQAEASDGMGNVSYIMSQSADFLDIFLVGNYTGLPGNTATTEGSMRLSFNLDGTALSSAITLTVPPGGMVPEPSSLGLLGTSVVLGLCGYRLVRGRHRRASAG